MKRNVILVACVVVACAIVFLHCAAPQRSPAANVACGVTNAADAHLNALVDDVEQLASRGQPIDPALEGAVAFFEVLFHAAAPALCPPRATLSPTARAHAIVASHPPQPAQVPQ